MLTERYKQALQFAATVHDEHLRKGTQVAYLSHLISVSALVMENGGDEDEARADLEQSLAWAVESGNAVYGLRAALALAQLPDERRSSDWKSALRTQVAAFGTEAESADLEAARQLLQSH